MNRFDAIKEIMKVPGNQLVVCNIGAPSKELYHIKDRPQNFYMLGSMGLASSIGLGLALSKPTQKVMVIEGDGAILMNLGSLATIAANNPRNLLLIVIDNGAYGSTGFQPTFTEKNTNLEEVAKGCGFTETITVTVKEKISSTIQEMLYSNELAFLLIKTKVGQPKTPIISISGIKIKDRFMKAIQDIS